MDEMDRDLQAIWRWCRFLERTARLSWDPEMAAECVGEYVRDPVVQQEMKGWRYDEIDGLAEPEEIVP